MIKLLFLAYAGICLNIEQLPKSRSPPERLIHSTSAAVKSTVYHYGGEKSDNSFSSSLFSYDLLNFYWQEIIPQSSLLPPALSRSKSFIDSKNQFKVLFGLNENGISEALYSFNLELLHWTQESLTGDLIYPSIDSADCLFTFKSSRYLALYGGVSSSGILDTFYLINTETLEVQSKTQGNPGKMTEASLVFHNDFLYLFGVQGKNPYSSLFKLDLTTYLWSEVKTNNVILSRKGQISAVFNNTLLVFFGYSGSQKFAEVLELDLLSLKWENSNSEEYLYGSSAQVFQNMVIFSLGRTAKSYENSLRAYFFESRSLQNLTFSSDFPVARKNHVSWVYSNSVYIFGGIGFDGVLLNDIWKYDVKVDRWEFVQTTGEQPEPRELAGNDIIPGVALVIVGGRSINSILSDVYMFLPKSLIWVPYKTSGGNMSPRHSSCVSTYSFKTLIFGGQDDKSAQNDFWTFDYTSSTFTKLEIQNEKILKIKNYRCAFEKTAESFFIYLIGGLTENNEVNDSVFKITLTDFLKKNQTIQASLHWKSDHLMLQDFSLNMDNSWTFLIGGRSGRELSTSILKLSLQEKTIEAYPVSDMLWVTSHTSAHLGQNFFIFGGVASKSGFFTSSRPKNQLFKLEDLNLTCRFGNITAEKCLPCKPGYFWTSGECLPCAPGSFFQLEGAEERQMCTPCGFGEFNEAEGQRFCKKCYSNGFCPVGSKTVLQGFMLLNSYSNQPEDFKSQTSKIDDLFDIFLISFLVISTFLLGLLIFFKIFREKVKKLDIFIDQHSQELNVPVIYRKTVIGGYFSFTFIVLALFFSVYNLFSFIEDNITETKSLVPLLTVHEKVSAAELILNATFFSFTGYCNESYFLIAKKSIKFQFSSKFFTLKNNNCHVDYLFKNFEITENGEIDIGFTHPIIYCSYISVKISSTSSIPGLKSEIFVPLYPKNVSHVIRGFRPSEFTFTLIPSVFYSDSKSFNTKLTGFHIIDTKTHEIGSTLDEFSFNSQVGLFIKIQLKLSENVLIITRLEKYSVFMFMSSIFGSILGIMGSFATFMAFYESVSEIYTKRRQRRISTLRIIHHRSEIDICNFDEFYKEKSNQDVKITDLS